MTLLALSALIARADEGRIPLFQPTTITAPGSYVVTNDFSAGNGTAIAIAANDVTIDLGGHTITGSVRVQVSNSEVRLTLRNGRIVGGLTNGTMAAAPKVPGDWMKLRLSRITGLGGGIGFFATIGFDMRESRIEGDIGLIGNVGYLHTQVLDSTVDGNMSIGGSRAGVIKGNSFGSLYLCAGDGFASEGNLIESNSIQGALTLNECSDGASRNLVRSNIAGAIVVNAHDNHLVGNSVRRGSMTVGGSRNFLESNAIQGPGVGLILNGDNNVYRGNTLHNNALGALQDNGTGNVDGGGNVL